MKNVLMLGADPATVTLYRRHFEQAGLALASAELVEPLEDFIRLAQPDAVLLDVTHPHSDGEALLRSIRAQPEFKTLPLFALTDRQPAAGSGMSLQGATKSFQKLPTLAPVVVKAVAAAFLTPQSEAAPPVQPTSPAAEPVGASSFPELLEEKRKQVEIPEPTLPEEATLFVQQLSDTFQQFCRVAEDERPGTLQTMQSQIRDLRRSLLNSESPVLTGFTSALARLLITLSKDLGQLNSSCVRTMSAALDVLSQAVAGMDEHRKVENGPVRVLIVDDDSLSRRALQFALSCPDLALVDSDSSESALECIRNGQFDVIFADARLRAQGDLVAQIHELPGQSELPVVTITPLPDFDTRLQPGPVGNSDLMAKPFTPSEMVIKAFTLGLRRRLGPAKAAGTERARASFSEAPTELVAGRTSNASLSPTSASSPATVSFRASPSALPPMRGITPLPGNRTETLDELPDAADRLEAYQPAPRIEIRANRPAAASLDTEYSRAVEEAQKLINELESQLEQEQTARKELEQRVAKLQERCNELQATLQQERSERQKQHGGAGTGVGTPQPKDAIAAVDPKGNSAGGSS